METLFVVLPQRTKGFKRTNLATTRILYTVSMINVLAHLHPDKILLGVKNVKSVSRIWGQNDGDQGWAPVKVKVAETALT